MGFPYFKTTVRISFMKNTVLNVQVLILGIRNFSIHKRKGNQFNSNVLNVYTNSLKCFELF